MLLLQRILVKQLLTTCGGRPAQHCRSITALYIPGDKATENYVTLQPYIDLEDTIQNSDAVRQSIARRKLNTDFTGILDKYVKYKDISAKMETLNVERETVANTLKELTKTGNVSSAKSTTLKERGKALRDKLRSLKASSYRIEEDFMLAFLNLPNVLHLKCPNAGKNELYRSAVPRVEHGETHLKRKELVRFVDNSRYYMLQEAAKFDVYSMQAMARYFACRGGFTATANPDFTRCVLLEANSTPLEHYHRVIEELLQNKLNAAYLTGGGAFESYLGAIAKLCIYPKVLPLKFVSCGRSYHKAAETSKDLEANLYTATQTNAVQTFVAAANAQDADQLMEKILNLAVDFYKALNIHFRVVYAAAEELTLSECLRAVIEVYSPAQQRYISVGHVSNYSDYVSKRLLFSVRQQKDYHFLHLVGGPILYTSRLIAALIESGIPLEQCNLLDGYEAAPSTQTQDPADKFKVHFDDFTQF